MSILAESLSHTVDSRVRKRIMYTAKYSKSIVNFCHRGTPYMQALVTNARILTMDPVRPAASAMPSQMDEFPLLATQPRSCHLPAI
jgi:hypothetical protein